MPKHLFLVILNSGYQSHIMELTVGIWDQKRDDRWKRDKLTVVTSNCLGASPVSLTMPFLLTSRAASSCLGMFLSEIRPWMVPITDQCDRCVWKRLELNYAAHMEASRRRVCAAKLLFYYGPILFWPLHLPTHKGFFSTRKRKQATFEPMTLKWCSQQQRLFERDWWIMGKGWH